MKERAAALVKEIDAVLIAFREGRLNLSQAIDKLMDPGILRGSGYGFHTEASRYEIPPSFSHSYEDWRLSAPCDGGHSEAVRRGFTRGDFIIPGIVRLSTPNFRGKTNFLSPKNRPIALRFLAIVAEELYHAAQHLNGYYYIQEERGFSKACHRIVISEYFKSGKVDLKDFSRRFANEEELFEADVYAKLLETLGSENIPTWQEYFYTGRRVVDRRKIVLAVAGRGDQVDRLVNSTIGVLCGRRPRFY